MKIQHVQSLLIFACLVLLPFLLINCGDSSSEENTQLKTNEPANNSKAIDACSLLSREEAEAILGVQLKEPELKSSYGTTSECNYAPADLNAGLDKSGNLQIRIEQPSNPKASLSNIRELMGEVEEINGLGEEAFYAATSQLFVIKGSYQVMITISLFGNRGSERKETAIKVAEKILPKL
jgi:hypothetical protein